MPSGPEGFVERPQYAEEFNRARELLFRNPVRWRVVYHYDGDGIAAASSLLRALQRLAYPFQATPLTAVERGRMEEMMRRTPGPMIVVDTGASWLPLLSEHPQPVIVLDHHRYVDSGRRLPSHVAFVNPLDWGVDGMSEMCAGTLSWLFTVFLDPRNWDNAPWGISGAIADRQHVGGFRGLNARLVSEARDRHQVEERVRLALYGPTLGEGLARSIDPFYVGLSGNPAGVERFLSDVGLSSARATESLSKEEEDRLTEALVARLRRQGARSEFCELVRRPSWRFPSLPIDGEELSNLQNATGRQGEPGVGVALALGEPSAFERARHDERAWREGIMEGLQRIERDGVNQLPAVQWFESPETPLAGTQAGLAMNYLVDSRRPLVVFSPSESGLKVSGRATPWLVEQGLDLSSALRTAAALVGGEGGGHRVASGATIPVPKRDAFLAEVDRLVSQQIPTLVAEAAT